MTDSRDKRQEPGEETFILLDRVVSPYVVAFHQPRGHHAEQYRALRNKIAAMNRSGAARSILITSPVAGDGKSITLMNLALVLAELERTRVLVVEADLRRPTLEPLIGLNPRPGLVQLLRDEIGPDEAIRESGFPGVDLIGAGARVDNPGGLLSSLRIQEFLAAMKESYRYILIDSPPVLPITDALSLGPAVDGALVVIRLDYTPRPSVERAIDKLTGVGTTVLGVFVGGVRGMGPGAVGPYDYPYGEEDDGS